MYAHTTFWIVKICNDCLTNVKLVRYWPKGDISITHYWIICCLSGGKIASERSNNIICYHIWKKKSIDRLKGDNTSISHWNIIYLQIWKKGTSDGKMMECQSDCWLMLLIEKCSAISWAEQVTFDEMMSALYYTNMLSGIYIVLAYSYWSISPQVDMPLHSNTY